MANPFENESTAIRVGPVESVQKSNLSSALALESKRNQIRKEFNNPNLTNEEVDRIIYLRENPEMPPSIGPAITHRDAYGRPLSQKQIEQRNKEHKEEVQETVNRNNGLRTFGYSNLSDKQAEQNPELVSQLEKDAAADITAKGLTMAAFIPGMQWLRGVSAPLYYGVNAGLTGASAYDWYKNGPNFWNVTGTIGGGFDLLLPTALKGYQNYQLGKALNQGINDIQTVKLPYNVGWGPRQTVSVTRVQHTTDPILSFYPERWDVVNEGANPLGAWFQGRLGFPRTIQTGASSDKALKAAKARNTFATRPVQLKGELTLEKPLVTVGEVPNRSTLSYQAEQLGSDGIIYNGVYDNGYNNNQVILAFNPESFNNTSNRLGVLTTAEKLGIPKGERNQPSNPSVQNSFNVQVSEIPVGFQRVSSRVGPASLLHEEPKSLPQQNEYITNLKQYIQTLPEGQAVDQLTINDYRQYLVNLGIGSKQLTDQEISKLLSNQFSELTKNQTGALKGTILYHGSPTLFDMFDYANSGRYTLNAGAVGPGNYFSTGRNSYGVINQGGFKSGNMQPYLITDVSSTPNSSLLMQKGLIPEYKSPPINLRQVHELQYRIRTTKDSKVREKLQNQLNELLNTPEYQEYYQNNIQNWIDNWKLDKNAFILDENRAPLQTLDVIGRNPNSFTQSLEGMIHRNTGIKSLFPHPSTLQQNPDGTWIISRNWSDPRVNFKLGGKLNYGKD